MDKLLSGRWLLTMAGAIVFIYSSLTHVLSSEAIIGILMYVFQSYFNKKEEVQKKGE